MKRGFKIGIMVGVVITIVVVGFLIANRPNSNTFVWKHQDETTFYDYSSPALDSEGNLYVGTSQKWYHEKSGEPLADHYYVYCLSQTTGEEKWKYDAGPKEIRGGPTLGLNNMLYVVAEAHDSEGFRITDELIALYRANGTVAWSRVITSIIYRDPARPNAPPYDQQDAWGLAILEPGIDAANNVYVAGEKFWSFYGNNGTIRWTYEGGATCHSPTVNGNLVLFAGKTFYALNKDTGVLQWTYGAGDGLKKYKPSINANGDIIFGTQGFSLVSLDKNG